MKNIEMTFKKALGIACRINKCHCVENMLLSFKNKDPQYHLVLDYALALPEGHECKNKCNFQTVSGCASEYQRTKERDRLTKEQIDDAEYIPFEPSPIVSETYEVKGETVYYPSSSKCFGAEREGDRNTDIEKEIKHMIHMNDEDCAFWVKYSSTPIPEQDLLAEELKRGF